MEPNWLRDKLRLSNFLMKGLDETTGVETETKIPLDLPKDVVTGPPKATDRDFFANLYSGDVTSGPLEPSSLTPEDYYAYLESWYRAQKGLCSQTAAFLEQQTGFGGEGVVGLGGGDGRVPAPHGHPPGRPLVLHEVSSPGGGSGISAAAMAAAAAGGIPSLSSSSSAAGRRSAAFAGGLPPPPRSTSTSTLPSAAAPNQHSGIYIPVSALENLRTSMPALAR